MRYFIVGYKNDNGDVGDICVKRDGFVNAKETREEIAERTKSNNAIFTFILEVNEEDYEEFNIGYAEECHK